MDVVLGNVTVVANLIDVTVDVVYDDVEVGDGSVNVVVASGTKSR